MQFNLNEKQKTAVQHKSGPLLIIAGAGTGKTAVITQRIIHIIKEKWAKPSEILALTFTEKAAYEMEERVDVSMPMGYEEPFISTFHSFCDRVLRQEGSYIGLDTNYKLMSSAQSYILFKKNLFNMPMDSFRPLGNPTSNIAAILSHFSRLQDEAVTPQEYLQFAQDLEPDDEIGKFTKEEYIELAKIYKSYTALKIKESSLDFGDLIIHTLNLFRQKPNILEKYKKQFKYILVDEYQDTNYTQNLLVNMLALGASPDKATKDNRKKVNLTVVGDDDQSIYKFRGAAISNILQFKETYPEATKVVLTDNYRSKQEILDASYQLITFNNPNRLEITENIDKRLISHVPSDKNEMGVQLMTGDTGSNEADLVAREILKLTGHKEILKNDSSIIDRKFDDHGQSMFIDVAQEDGAYKFSDISILVRAHSHADEFIQILKQYGIPFKHAGPKGLYSRPEVAVLISFMKSVVNREDSVSAFNIMKMPEWDLNSRELIQITQELRSKKMNLLDWLEDQFSTKLGTEGEIPDELDRYRSELSDNASNLFKKIFSTQAQTGLIKLFVCYDRAYRMISDTGSIGAILYEFFKNSGYLDNLLAEDTFENTLRVQNISKFFDLIKRYEQENLESNLFEYVDFIQYSIDIGENPKVEQDLLDDYDAVTISTVHGAKGLEWPVVFLVNLVKGRFPGNNRSDKIPIPEELIKETLSEEDGGDAHIQEERRLAYVGATRAKARLYLTAASIYGDGVRKKKPSLFLDEILNRKITDEDFVAKNGNGNGQKPRFEVNISANDEIYNVKDLKLKVGEWVSYSQLNQYERCPRQYQFGYVYKLPGPPSSSLSFGISIHNALNSFYKQHKEAASGIEGLVEFPTEDDLKRYFEAHWISSGYESKKHEEVRKESGYKLVEEYYKNLYSKDDNPVALESPFRLKVGDSTVIGKIDRIDLVKEEDGKKVVDLIDYKTGKVKDMQKLKRDALQLSIYALAAEEAMDMKVNKVAFWYVEHGKKTEFEITKAMKIEAKAKISDIVERIQKKDFTPTPGMFTCGFCNYKEICEDAEL